MTVWFVLRETRRYSTLSEQTAGDQQAKPELQEEFPHDRAKDLTNGQFVITEVQFCLAHGTSILQIQIFFGEKLILTHQELVFAIVSTRPTAFHLSFRSVRMKSCGFARTLGWLAVGREIAMLACCLMLQNLCQLVPWGHLPIRDPHWCGQKLRSQWIRITGNN